MNIEFENGSKVESIGTDKETKRGYIRGKQLSDQEYNRIVDAEIDNAENMVSEIIKYMKLDRYYTKQPSEFVEQFLGVKLLGYQKKILDMQHKASVFIQNRSPQKKYELYLRLLCSYVNMKEDGEIAIAKYPDNVKVLTKEEFGRWLQDEYWK